MKVRRTARTVLGILAMGALLMAARLVPAEAMESTLLFAAGYSLCAATVPLLALLAEQERDILED